MAGAASVADYFEVTYEQTGDGRNSAVEVSVPENLMLRLCEPGRIVLDQPPVWAWRNPDRNPQDLVAAVGGVRLLSPRLRDILQANLGPHDEVQWLPAELELLDGRRAEHWILHLPVHHDLLSDDGTHWQPNGIPMRHAYSRAKLTGHHVTAYTTRAATYTVPIVGTVHTGTRANTSRLVVTAAVIDDMAAVDITGVRVVPATLGLLHGWG